MINLVIFINFILYLFNFCSGIWKDIYQIFFNNINFKEDINIYVGFYGLMFLTLIALFTSFFFKHNFYHNIFIHFIGVFYFFYLSLKKNLNYYKHIFYISIIFNTSIT